VQPLCYTFAVVIEVDEKVFLQMMGTEVRLLPKACFLSLLAAGVAKF
jgi:hypothetical protein